MRLSEKLQRIKYPLLAVLAAGSLGTAIFSGVNCYSNSNANQEETEKLNSYKQELDKYKQQLDSQNANLLLYNEALDKYGQCESYLIEDKFQEASQCIESFALLGQNTEFSENIKWLSNRLYDSLQDSMQEDYSLLLSKAEAELNQGRYDSALSLSSEIEKELQQLDFFEKQDEFISKANDLERKIEAEKQKPEEQASYVAEYYNKIKAIYLGIGFGQPLSDIAAALTLLLPAYGVIRKLRKRII
ncbi:MAG: hypothetical protein WC852_03530 [Candidatus Nanoarchaeia archaeon]|jgi:hypothetical protein